MRYKGEREHNNQKTWINRLKEIKEENVRNRKQERMKEMKKLEKGKGNSQGDRKRKRLK